MIPKGYDRIDKNESDGQIFYGYDDKERGTTDWYTVDGFLDCTTPTPTDEDDFEE